MSAVRIAQVSEQQPGRRARITVLAVTSGLVGVGVPLGWFLMLGANGHDPRGGTTEVGAALGGVVATYLLFWVLAATAAGHARAVRRGRRMRLPWERGLTEWQPAGWTYHLVEEILIGAALVSAGTCVILMITVGGFAG